MKNREKLTIPPIGAFPLGDNRISFSLWAPFCERVSLKLCGEEATILPMERGDMGLYKKIVEVKGKGHVDYCYLLEGERERADPASFWQPYGVECRSRVLEQSSYEWSDNEWKGIAIEEMIFYELHVATFTKEGTFDALIDKLPHLVELGINAVQLMPICTFSGERNWGYDGVMLFSPQESYGGPEGLKRLVDACHSHGIALFLDLVYNHFGPEGNYLREFGPYFSDKYKTPWGPAINYDEAYSPFVREYVITNALYWLEEYHVDGLRLDAIHGIFDGSAQHLLEELSLRFEKRGKELGRKAYLIAESDLNDTRVIKRRDEGGYGIDAQWNDDFHHAIHAKTTGRSLGYFADFGEIADIAKAIEEGFVYDGAYSHYRKRNHGSPSKGVAKKRFVNCIQNHDQIANAANGKRLNTIVSDELYKIASALLLLSPSPPLLFMGQEWGADEPFYFFTDFADVKLQEAVRRGRLAEYAAHGIEEGFADPGDSSTFSLSTLDWRWRENPVKEKIFSFYKEMIALRKNHPALSPESWAKVTFSEEEGWLQLVRCAPSGEKLTLAVDFKTATLAIEEERK